MKIYSAFGTEYKQLIQLTYHCDSLHIAYYRLKNSVPIRNNGREIPGAYLNCLYVTDSEPLM